MKVNNEEILKDVKKWLYIPHGSDERGIWKGKKGSLPNLYIPHGSDESQKLLDTYEVIIYSFISHMVQMKAISSGVS